MEQRRVAGREPPSEQRSAGQPGFLGESQVHLHLHRAPISATQPTDLLLTGIRDTRSRAMDILATRDTPLTPALRAMDTRAARSTLPTPVPVMDIPCLVIPETALRRTGRLGPSTLSSLLAELPPRIHPQCLTPLAVARANASVKSIALVGMGDPRSQQRHEDRQACQHRTFHLGGKPEQA